MKFNEQSCAVLLISVGLLRTRQVFAPFFSQKSATG